MAAFSFSILSLLFLLNSQGAQSGLPLELTGNNFFSDSFLTSKRKNPKNQEELENLIEEILTTYNNAGFAFCRLSPEVRYLRDRVIEKIILKIEEGERVIITDYLFSSPAKTSASALKRFIHYKAGDYFSLREVQRVKRLMLKTGVFKTINEHLLYRQGSYYLLFDLTENQTDYLVGAGSFAEQGLNWGFSFYSINLLGTLRQFQFQYEYKRLFLLEYTDPVLVSPVVFNTNFSLWTHDSVRLAKLTGKITAPVWRYFNLSLISGIALTSYDTTTNRGSVNKLLGTSLDFNYESPNWSVMQAINFECLFRKADRLTIRYDGAFILAKFFFKPHWWWVNTEIFDYFDYLRIGGAKNIRGYLEEEFAVKDVFWLNIEYKRYFLYPLLDIARFEDYNLFSYGFGMDAKSDFANASIVFAWPKDGKWRDGKVHILFEKGL